MARKLRRRWNIGKKTNGGGGQSAMGKSAVVGLMSQVIGGAFILFALILFGIAINQLDTSYTSAATYLGQVGLTDIMGMFGMVIFLVFIGAGISVVAGGAVYNFSQTIHGGWMQAFLSFAMGAVGLVIALILNTISQTQLQAAGVTINGTTNIANFSGLYDVWTIFGMLIFLVLIGSGISGVVAAGVGAIRNIRGGF